MFASLLSRRVAALSRSCGFFAGLILTVAPALATPQFTFLSVNQKVEAQAGGEALQSDSSSSAADFGNNLDSQGGPPYREAQTSMYATWYSTSHIAADDAGNELRAINLAAAQAHVAFDFTVNEACEAEVAILWQGSNSNNDAGVTNIQIYIEDLETNELVLYYLNANPDGFDEDDTTVYTVETLQPNHEYRFVAHFDALSVDGGYAYLSTWWWDLQIN